MLKCRKRWFWPPYNFQSIHLLVQIHNPDIYLLSVILSGQEPEPKWFWKRSSPWQLGSREKQKNWFQFFPLSPSNSVRAPKNFERPSIKGLCISKSSINHTQASNQTHQTNISPTLKISTTFTEDASPKIFKQDGVQGFMECRGFSHGQDHLQPHQKHPWNHGPQT